LIKLTEQKIIKIHGIIRTFGRELLFISSLHIVFLGLDYNLRESF
jgi:hypothetical protein